MFLAVFPSPEVTTALQELRARLEPKIPGLRWTLPVNLHFTLRFFGDLDRHAVTAAAEVAEAATASAVPFRITLEGLGVFGSWSRPRVLWVGVAGGRSRLEALARVLHRGFAAAGLGRADKPFAAHLTLGRWRDLRDLDLGAAREVSAAVGGIGRFQAEEVVLVRSILGDGGSRYDPVSRHRLRGGPAASPEESRHG